MPQRKSSFLDTLEEHKQACASRRLRKIRPLPELARIFRAQIGDPEAQGDVTVGEAELYEPAETFDRFLKINRLPEFERVLR